MYIYIDDFIVACHSREEAIKAVATLQRVVNLFGLRLAKWQLGQTVTWIGYMLDASISTPAVTIPDDKIDQLCHDLHSILQRRTIRIKSIQAIAGRVMFLAQVIRPLAPLLAPLFELMRARPNSGRGAVVRITSRARSAMGTLRSCLLGAPPSWPTYWFADFIPEEEIFCDASTAALGIAGLAVLPSMESMLSMVVIAGCEAELAVGAA